MNILNILKKKSLNTANRKSNDNKSSFTDYDYEKSNNEIAGLTYFFVILFVGLIIYLIYFTLFQSSDVINNSYNSRQEIYAKRIVRGDILSSKGDVLATTIIDESGNEVRFYPFSNMFAHIVGFTGHGKSGIEALYTFPLLTSNMPVTTRISNDLKGDKNLGDSVITTLNLDMQQAAYSSLGNYKGAVVALDCNTGEILCMVSKPDYDPNTIAANWDYINSDYSDSALLNRATQGLYPPGSTFKIVTALEYLKENDNNINIYSYDCNGSFSYEGNTINCYHGQKHGNVDLERSFAKSCNSSFANISTTINKESFQKTCEELLFGKDLPIKMNHSYTSIPVNAESQTDELIQASIGQGNTQISPIHMAMITSAIANDGLLMKPYIVKEVINKEGKIIKNYSPSEYGNIIEKQYANSLKILMEDVINEGTGSKLINNRYTAAGKTGSAEFSTNKSLSHAWFTGYAPADNPKVAIVVIAEEAGSGGDIAVPIAKAVFDAYFK